MVLLSGRTRHRQARSNMTLVVSNDPHLDIHIRLRPAFFVNRGGGYNLVRCLNCLR